jgi:hypothetical protein
MIEQLEPDYKYVELYLHSSVFTGYKLSNIVTTVAAQT